MSVQGGPARPVVLRATQIYRWENGEWKLVHRVPEWLSGCRLLPCQASKGSVADVWHTGYWNQLEAREAG